MARRRHIRRYLVFMGPGLRPAAETGKTIAGGVRQPTVTTTLPMALRLPRWAMASAPLASGKLSET